MARSERLKVPPSASRGREIAGIVLLALALFLGLSVASLQLGSGSLMGPGGAGVALVGLTGLLVSLVVTTALRMTTLGRALRAVGVRLWSGFARVTLALFPTRGKRGRPSLREADFTDVPAPPPVRRGDAAPRPGDARDPAAPTGSAPIIHGRTPVPVAATVTAP